MPVNISKPLTPDIAKCWEDPCHETLRRMPMFILEKMPEILATVEHSPWLIILSVFLFLAFVWNLVNSIVMCILNEQWVKRNKHVQLIETRPV